MRALVAVVTTMFLGLASAACVHVPTEKESKEAQAEYKVALSLVHEAQASAVAGEGSQQDLKYRLALESLLKAKELDPRLPEVNYLLGLVYFSGFKRHEQAIEHVKLAIDASEKAYPEAENLLGTILVDAGRPREAVPYLQSARSNLLYKTPYYSESELGWAYYKLGEKDRGATHLRAAINAQPDLCGAYVKLAEVEEARQDQAAVRQTLDRFLTRCDSERLRENCGDHLLAWGYWRLGMSKLKEGDRPGAVQALTTCQQRFAQQPVAGECARSLKLLQ